MLLCQIVGADQAIQSAMNSGRGYEAVLLVVVCIAIVGAFVWTMRKMMSDAKEREDRLSARVTHLEEVIRVELFSVLRQNSEIMGQVLQASQSICVAADRMTGTLERFTHILDVRPCLLPTSEQRKFIKDKLEGHHE
jgi:hypothetical protein